MDPKAYASARAGKSKMVKGCFIVRFNVGANACIANMTDDLEEIGAYFTAKPVRNLETNTSMAF